MAGAVRSPGVYRLRDGERVQDAVHRAGGPRAGADLNAINLAAKVADGGLATELEARGNDLSDSLWSARLLADAPGQILDAHLAFFRAGAQIATSASYQASFEGFAGLGLDRREAAEMVGSEASLAVAWAATEPEG